MTRMWNISSSSMSNDQRFSSTFMGGATVGKYFFKYLQLKFSGTHFLPQSSTHLLYRISIQYSRIGYNCQLCPFIILTSMNYETKTRAAHIALKGYRCFRLCVWHCKNTERIAKNDPVAECIAASIVGRVRKSRNLDSSLPPANTRWRQ